MKRHLNINRRTRLRAFFGLVLIMILQPAFADTVIDEDEFEYQAVIKPSFKKFHKKYSRYPRNWIESGVQDSCTSNSQKEQKHFPKPSEAIIWTPNGCELSYTLVFSSKSSFRVVALAKGHVVSIYENFKGTYYTTSYHDHDPYSRYHRY
jgi:hypothetical protein